MKNLSKQLNETELSTYRLNLQYEKLKCYIKLKKYGPVRMLSHEMFTDAHALGSIAWQMNALIMSVISESRARVQVSQLKKCMETLEFMLPISRTLGDKNITDFLTKVRVKNIWLLIPIYVHVILMYVYVYFEYVCDIRWQYYCDNFQTLARSVSFGPKGIMVGPKWDTNRIKI